MDPDSNLAEQVVLSQTMLKAYHDEDSNGIDQDDAARLAELVEALHGWICKGGALPKAWVPREAYVPKPARVEFDEGDCY